MSVVVKDLIASREQNEILEAVEAMLRQHLPLDRLRLGGGVDNTEHSKWSFLAEMGLFGVSLPIEIGGIGLGVVEDVLISVLIGRYLVSPSIIATNLAAHLAFAGGRADLARAMITGESRCALAIRTGSGLRILDGPFTSHVIVVDPNEALMFDRKGLKEITPRESYDESIAVEDAGLGSSPLLSMQGGVLHRYAGLMVSGYLAGISRATLEFAVEHAKNRVQFTRPIGSMQAIKHHCANMATQVNAASCLSLFAALSLKDNAPDVDFQIAASRLVSGSSASFCSALNIQVHGAMGFTAECLAHFYVKRAHMMDRLTGGRQHNADSLLVVASPFSKLSENA